MKCLLKVGTINFGLRFIHSNRDLRQSGFEFLFCIVIVYICYVFVWMEILGYNMCSFLNGQKSIQEEVCLGTAVSPPSDNFELRLTQLN